MSNSILLVKLIFNFVIGLFSSSPFDITLIDPNTLSQEATLELKNFEASFSYPFSNTEEFKIQHGKDGNYFAFFERLGKPYYYMARNKENKKFTKTVDNETVTLEHKRGELAAVGCGILRKLKTYNGTSINAWYICDLKVNTSYQGEHLPLIMTQKALVPRFVQCPRGFGICMNPPSGEPKAAGIFKKHGPIPGLDTQTLNLYTLSAQDVKKHQASIEDCLKKHGYLNETMQINFVSTNGAKDYIIFDKSGNNQRPWHLFHMNVDTTRTTEYHHDGCYMISSVDTTPLDTELKSIIGSPSSTAQIVSFGMKDVDFNFLTSDQI